MSKQLIGEVFFVIVYLQPTQLLLFIHTINTILTEKEEKTASYFLFPFYTTDILFDIGMTIQTKFL